MEDQHDRTALAVITAAPCRFISGYFQIPRTNRGAPRTVSLASYFDPREHSVFWPLCSSAPKGHNISARGKVKRRSRATTPRETDRPCGRPERAKQSLTICEFGFGFWVLGHHTHLLTELQQGGGGNSGHRTESAIRARLLNFDIACLHPMHLRCQGQPAGGTGQQK